MRVFDTEVPLANICMVARNIGHAFGDLIGAHWFCKALFDGGVVKVTASTSKLWVSIVSFRIEDIHVKRAFQV
jgi:hypothetical protein